jgi:leucyl aminopeptidase
MKLLSIAICLLSAANVGDSFWQGRQPQGQVSMGPVGKSLSERFRPDGIRLLSVTENEADWMDPEQLIADGIKFIDVTDHLDLDLKAQATREKNAAIALPSKPKRSAEIKPLLGKLDTKAMEAFLTELTSFHNRYYRSETGVASSDWLKSKVSELADKSGLNVTVEHFGHSWPQSSLIARIYPKKQITSIMDTPTVIVGAHQDTVRGGFFSDGRAPGADDDGSGTTSTLEAFRVLMANGYQPNSNILEFHWYSAEEVGLRGSQDVASRYQREGRLVKGMMQFDMTGFTQGGTDEKIGIITDFTDPELTSFLRTLVRTYSKLPSVDSKCNYGCSDHASWNKAGFRSAFPFEGTFSESSPYIHKKEDTVEHVNFEHMKEFSKLAVAFAVELAD